MGVLNVTPDSFSDGGQFTDVVTAVEQAVRMQESGADILDIGGESTRPGAAEVSVEEELSRVIPVIQALAPVVQAAISIDTRKVKVAEAALQAGASIVNDVEASRPDSAMWDLVAKSGAGYVAMHMQGSPQTMQNAPAYSDVVDEVGDFFEALHSKLLARGVPERSIVYDPGIGFGKSIEHNLKLLKSLRDLKTRSRPLLLGVSRKSFIGKLFGTEVEDRMPASVACAICALQHGTRIFRVHDVIETRRAIDMAALLVD